MSIEKIGKETESERILAKMRGYKRNPDDMLTLNMGGKMEGFNSLSSSCKAADSNCARRIALHIQKIKDFSPAACDVITRYMLPSKDKRHISSTKCAEMLVDMGVRVCVCIFCYADKAQAWQDGARQKFIANADFLSDRELDADALPMFPRYDVNGNAVARIEAEGDVQNVTHACNIIKICRNQPNITFALWTKNPGFIWKACERYGKPENLILVLSSENINEADNFKAEYFNRKRPGFVDYVFTVYTDKYAVANGIEFNCCDGRRETKCKNCMHCYTRGGSFHVNEILR